MWQWNGKILGGRSYRIRHVPCPTAGKNNAGWSEERSWRRTRDESKSSSLRCYLQDPLEEKRQKQWKIWSRARGLSHVAPTRGVGMISSGDCRSSTSINSHLHPRFGFQPSCPDLVGGKGRKPHIGCASTFLNRRLVPSWSGWSVKSLISCRSNLIEHFGLSRWFALVVHNLILSVWLFWFCPVWFGFAQFQRCHPSCPRYHQSRRRDCQLPWSKAILLLPGGFTHGHVEGLCGGHHPLYPTWMEGPMHQLCSGVQDSSSRAMISYDSLVFKSQCRHQFSYNLVLPHLDMWVTLWALHAALCGDLGVAVWRPPGSTDHHWSPERSSAITGAWWPQKIP